MASIVTSIQLIDNVSAPINNMISSINSMCSAYKSAENSMNGSFNNAKIESANRSINNTTQTAINLSNSMNKVESSVNNATQQVNSMSSGMTKVESAVSNTSQKTTTLASNMVKAETIVNTTAQKAGEIGNQINGNTHKQEQFNNAINDSHDHMNNFLGKVQQIAAAYLGFQTVKKAINVSDELTQTTARLNMMNSDFNKINGTAMETNDLVKMVYQSAQSARGSFSDMAAVVAKFGNNAREAFSSQEEVVKFATLVQKQMTIAGASTEEASNAMLQLSQALGSGVLRGDELNSIFEQAPNLIQSIADYMGIPIGQIRAMAQEGKLSADIVKQAIFASADDINAKFKQMPTTWGQLWTSMSNSAIMMLQPLLVKINELANNQSFQTMINGIMIGLVQLSLAFIGVIDLAAGFSQILADNWEIVVPIIYGIVGALAVYLIYLGITNGLEIAHAIVMSAKIGVMSAMTGTTMAATAAQLGYNGALYACPIVWIIILIIALIAIIYAVCAAIANMTGVANTGFGIITGGINVVIQFFKNLGLSVANIALGIWSALSALCQNMMTAFNNAICNIKSWWYGLLSASLKVIAGICAALNKLPFVNFDYSGISSKASAYAAKSQKAAGTKGKYQDVGAAFSKGFGTYKAFESGWAGKAFSQGASWGDGVMKGFSNKFKIPKMLNMPKNSAGNIPNASNQSNLPSSPNATGGNIGSGENIPKHIANTAGNTGRMADTLDRTSEDLKYLRDIAERDVINRFTTAEIKVDLGGVTNNVSTNMDLDGVVDYLATGVQEAMEKVAEGVHV